MGDSQSEFSGQASCKSRHPDATGKRFGTIALMPALAFAGQRPNVIPAYGIAIGKMFHRSFKG
jgi:hypothetical protein